MQKQAHNEGKKKQRKKSGRSVKRSTRREASKQERRKEETREAMYAECIIQARSCNHCCSGKAMTITQTECVFAALGIQHAMRACAILSSVVCPIINISPHYLIHFTIFEKRVI
jgi:hypothetical protein